MRPFLRYVLSCALIFCATCSVALAEESPCENLPPSTLEVTRVFGDSALKYVATPAAIAKLATKGGAIPPQSLAAHPMLLTPSDLMWQVKVEHRVVNQNGVYCNAPVSVDVWIGFARRSVVLAQDAAKIPCLKQALLEHHASHVKYGDEALGAYLPTTKEAIGEALRKAKYTPFSSEEQAKSQFESAVKAAVQKTVSRFEVDLRYVEQKIDAPEEVEKVLSCSRKSKSSGTA